MQQEKAVSFDLFRLDGMNGCVWRGKQALSLSPKALAEIYGWFTEGFDTAELKEAKALLEQLS